MRQLPVTADTVLVAIPTYNERANIRPLLERLQNLPGDWHILYIDDNSPDGTADEVESAQQEYANLLLMRRPGKLGLGSAHQDALRYAYQQGYRRLATMDADLTHDPEILPRMLELLEQSEVVVASRYLLKNSLPGWDLYRRFMTHFGHWLTKFLLKMPYDATGALRIYNLSTIPQTVFDLVRSTGYSFFYESLFILWNNGCRVTEVAVKLPSRTYGSSKMSTEQVFVSALRLILIYTNQRLAPDLYCHKGMQRLELTDASSWGRYWGGMKHQGLSDLVFEICATWFRSIFNKPFLERIMSQCFKPGDRLLHVGCGSGHVDQRLRHQYSLQACDISHEAVHLYNQLNRPYVEAFQGDLMQLDFPDGVFDGVYNLGVMEHFTEDEILRSLREFWRMLRPGGQVVLFWPPLKSPIYPVLLAFGWLSKLFDKKNQDSLYPPEISRARSQAQVEAWLRQTGFEPVYCELSYRDLYTQYVFVARK